MTSNPIIVSDKIRAIGEKINYITRNWNERYNQPFIVMREATFEEYTEWCKETGEKIWSRELLDCYFYPRPYGFYEVRTD